MIINEYMGHIILGPIFLSIVFLCWKAYKVKRAANYYRVMMRLKHGVNPDFHWLEYRPNNFIGRLLRAEYGTPDNPKIWKR